MNRGFLKTLRFFHLINKKAYKKRMKKYAPEYRAIAKSPLFDAKWYLEHNPDVAAAKADPVEHYLTIGWKEDRPTTPYFDGKAYLQMYPDVAEADMNPLAHYELFGKKEGRKSNKKCGTTVTLPKNTEPRKDVFFSVIVASYNYRDYIQETLDSLVNQTYTDFEVIVVDDGSTDDSVEVIQQYVDKYPFIYLYRHPNGENKGLPATVKLGVEKSKGEYIAFCESDDYWTANHLAEVNKQICSKFDAKIIVNDVKTFGDEDRCEEMERVISFRKNKVLKSDGLIADKDFREANYIVTFSACCVRRGLLQSCDFLGVPKKTALDWWLWRQICLNSQITYIDKKLTKWRLHKSYNIRDKRGEAEKHKQFVRLLDAIIEKRGYASVFQKNEFYSNYTQAKKLELTFQRRRIVEKIKNGDLRNLKICYISTTGQIARPINDGSTRYRCYFPAEALSATGAFVSVTDYQRFCKSLSYAYDVYVFHRPNIAQKDIVENLRKIGKVVIADYDDLIFGNQRVAEQSSLFKNRKENINTIVNIFENNLRALLWFDFVSVSTEALAKEVTAVHPDAHIGVVHNFIPDSIFYLSDEIGVNDCEKDKNLIMYCSGTLSHNVDFLEIKDVMTDCLERDRFLKLVIFGVLSADAEIQKSERIFFHPPVDYWDLFRGMKPAAFTIAPLEKTRFNECKSNVKFLESSVSRCHLLASPIGDMQRVADADLTLCQTASDWKNAILNRHDFDLNKSAVQNREYIRKHCSSGTFLTEFLNIFNGMEN